jgi:hypothetical protein
MRFKNFIKDPEVNPIQCPFLQQENRKPGFTKSAARIFSLLDKKVLISTVRDEILLTNMVKTM